MKPRIYRTPDARAIDRFEVFEGLEDPPNSDASIDKVDYLLVFPITEGQYANSAIANSTERVLWSDVEVLWRAAMTGSEEFKAKSVKHLGNFWKSRTGVLPKPNDTIKKSTWLSIAREAIIDQLSSKSGLKIKVTSTNNYILCGLNAPIKLLELQADDENYRLEFKGEIDPGTEEFWNQEVDGEAVELVEADKLYTIDEANIILEKMFKAGKIQPFDLGVYLDVESQRMFSRRVHALERVADRVPVWNKYPAYAPYTTKSHLRYLFKTHLSTRGKTILRYKDRMYLTKAILDRYFDFDMLVVDGILIACMALHDANRGESLTIDSLSLYWVTFWRASATEVGSPLVSDDAYEPHVPVAWYLVPFSQPFHDIREYFGEKIALYFAWLGFYTYYLTFAAALGLGLELVFIVRGHEDVYNNIDWFVVGFIILSVMWNVFYKNGWERECSTIALKWGTKGFEATEKNRPQFRGDPAKPIKRSNVNNQNGTYFPDRKRRLITVWSFTVLFFVLCINVGLIGSIFYGEALVVNVYTDYYFDGFTWVVNFIQALQMVVTSWFFEDLVVNLTDTENHQTETAYEDALITKTLIFQLINNFGVPLFTAFGKGPLLNSCYETCLNDLRQLLYVIIIVRTFINLCKMTYPYLKSLYEQFEEAQGEAAQSIFKKLRTKEAGSWDVHEFVDEIGRVSYKGTFDDYAESVVQYGYINFFSNAVPLLAAISCIENLIKIRMNAHKLCNLTKRPHVRLAEDVGRWGDLMDLISILGVVSSVGIVCFTVDNFDNYSYYIRAVIFMIAQQVLLAFKFALQNWYSPELDMVDEVVARNEFVISRFYEGYDDDNGESTLGTGHLNVDIDHAKIKLFDIRQAKPFQEHEYSKLEELELKKREMIKELKILKEQLQDVYKYETFNENTGIGETKHGLALGRLSVKLIEIQELKEPPSVLATQASKFVANFPIKVRVMIQGTRRTGKLAGPPLSSKSDSQVRKLDANGRVVFNQAMGPYAPITTQDADVVFEVLDMSPNAAEASVATTSIRLRELLDQKTHHEVLNLKIRSDDGSLVPADSRLFVSLLFHYSKAVPIRTKIYALQDKIRSVEKEMKLIRDRKN